MMDHRGSLSLNREREPLGDATRRVNNSSSNVSSYRPYRPRAESAENMASYGKASRSRGRSNPAAQLVVHPPTPIPERNDDSFLADTSMEEKAVDPRLSAITHGSREAEKRASQFSNISSNASSTRQLKTHIGPWQLGKTLGKGTSARVRLARHRVSHQLVAVKIVSKINAHITQARSLANLDKIDYRKPQTSADGGLRRMPLAIEREVAILKLIQHPNIIKLYDIWENKSEIYLVTEFVEKGDMFQFISYNGCLTDEEAMWYFRQIMSALEYCHSFNICHRDLKPENILLKADGTVKIADFGMAALHQGPAHQLRTACGSPHYAAPELLRHQYYKGPAIDIWSMGVILFAMLAGRLPFDDDDLNAMLTKAKRAEYTMPTHISREAENLIRRILVVSPHHRITMQQMWKHPLVRRYEHFDKIRGRPRSVQRDMKLDAIPEDQVDIQLLRQLRSMWHAFSDAQLKEKLRSDQQNDQKLFYWLLYSHREEQLENYNNDVPISKTDYHHLKPPNWGRRISTCQFTQPGRNGHSRSVSRFTVISNAADLELEEVGTIKSYDPYNASRGVLQHCNSQVSHAKIVVHRNNSHLEPNRDGNLAPGALGTRVPSAARTISHSYRSYRSVNGSFRQQKQRRAAHSQRTGILHTPRGSMGSIQSSRNGTPQIRVNSRTKRGVDFSDVRRRSSRDPRRRLSSRSGDENSQRRAMTASASIAGDNTTYGRDMSSPHKRGPSTNATKTKSMMDFGRNKKKDSVIWTEELKQFSNGIARDCDEAFQSSLITSESVVVEGDPTRAASPFSLSFGTPSMLRLSNVSASGALDTSTPNNRPWDTRPLPPLPSDESPALGTSKTNDKKAENVTVLAASSTDRRVVSEPVRDVRPLPSILENGRKSKDTSRIVSAPPMTPGRGSLMPEPTPGDEKTGLELLARAEKTIRIVNSPTAARTECSSVKVPSPLNVRKISGGTTNTHGPDPKASGAGPNAPAHLDLRAVREGAAPRSYRFSSDNGHDQAALGDSSGADSNPNNKRRGHLWFKRSSRANKEEEASGGSSSFVTVTDSNQTSSHDTTDVTSETVVPRERQQERQVSFRTTTTMSHWAEDPVEPMSPPNMMPPPKKRPFSLSFWKSTKKEPKMSLAGPEYLDDSPSPIAESSRCGGGGTRRSNKSVTAMSGALSRALATPSPGPSLMSGAGGWQYDDGGDGGDGVPDTSTTVGPTRQIEVHQNWLARLFRVKPATRYLCMGISRRRARQEMAILLREWRKYGIRDVEVDKERNLVFARVCSRNYLNAKEVSFAIEIMTVIEHGKRNHFSIARFTQEKGAASSFHRVVDAMKSVFTSRAILVADKRKTKMMIKTLNS